MTLSARRAALLTAILLTASACDPRPATSTNSSSTDSSPASATTTTTTTGPATAFRPEPDPASQPVVAPVEREAYEYRPGSPDGIGKWYMGREIARVMGHQGAGWLERAEREQEERPSKLIEILSRRIERDDVLADIGAGTGYYSFRLAPLMPKGKVLAVDVQQEMLDILAESAKTREVTNVEPVLGEVDDPKLPDNSVDWVLLVDAYHEFDHPREMMQGIRRALKPGGKVLLVEFRGEDRNVPIKLLHKMTEAQAKRELSAAGLTHVETIAELPWQHVMVFEKPR
jgi:ubiquinone/menaquinone biosynthesis C-methylase UbiE